MEPCDWGPVGHNDAAHIVKYECPYCKTYKVIQLCHACWVMINDYDRLFCLSCLVPVKVPVDLLYTHMGAA
jgi:hypothetical protein